MNKECDITQDLLFGYTDETLNVGSKEFVEEHLKKCENCKKIYDEIKNDKSNENEEAEVDYLKKIRKNNRKNIIVVGVITILAIFLLISIIAFVNYARKANKLEIFVSDNITEEQIENIKKMIKEKDNNANIIKKSKEDALQEIRDKLDKPELLDGYQGDNNIFPASLIVETKFYKTKEIKEFIEDVEGVKSIVKVNANPYMLLLGEIYTKYFKNEKYVIQIENFN